MRIRYVFALLYFAILIIRIYTLGHIIFEDEGQIINGRHRIIFRSDHTQELYKYKPLPFRIYNFHNSSVS